MTRFIPFFFGLMLFVQALTAQVNTENLTARLNKYLQHQQTNFRKSTKQLHVDSIAVKKSIIEVYFNVNNSYSKGSFSAEDIEALPELLTNESGELDKFSLLLLAKDKSTNHWKTLETFTDLPPAAKYIPRINKEPHLPKEGLKNSPSENARIFPSGTGTAKVGGALQGKTVWLSPGHGWHNTGTGFSTQRGTTNGLVEDFITAESIDYYLTHYLFNAGANVWSVRERDVNSSEIIVDNDNPSSGYSETGNWTTGSIAGYGGTYRVATSAATENASAVFTPNITQSGLYWVSVRCVAGTNRSPDVSFTIIHSGDTSIVNVNQEIHSDTWVHVGQYYFTAGLVNKITISNKSAELDQAIIADAVRLGGGIGTQLDCLHTGQPASGRSRFEESARQFAIYQGYPTCNEDVTVRPRFAEYELSKGYSSEINNAVYVSWHTNAGGGTGTETYHYNGQGSGRPNITAGSQQLTTYIHNQIVDDIKAGWKSTWANRGVKNANFGELRELNTIPGTLIELAFHDLAADATDLKHPEFRRLAARAIYKGILKFFNNRDATPLVYLPEQPTNVIAKNIGNNTIQLNWNAPSFGGILGDAATAYKVYVSTNGKSFKDGITVTNTNFTFTGNPQTIYYFKISATNAGGESFSSSVVAAKTPVSGTTTVPYLIVDAFDRLDGSALIQRTESAVLGTVSRMFLERMNRYDYMIDHAVALGTCFNFAFDGCQNEAVSNGSISLSNYQAVDWFTGEESTVDRSVDDAEKTILKAYLNNGGHLLISGAEIGWDIGRAASANADLDFYNNYLKATYVGDDANTYNFSGTTTLFNNQSGSFDDASNGIYNVDFPDRIAIANGSTVALNYAGGTGDGAAVGFKGTYNLLYLAFPFESIISQTVKNNLMCNAVAYLTPGITLPANGLQLLGKNSSQQNIIEWTTTAEINIQYYFVERSDNGVFYQPLSAAILPKGSVIGGASYQFIDANPLVNGYYRIKVVDIDGKISFSNTIQLRKENGFKLFQIGWNAASKIVQIQMNQNGAAEVMITNSIGKVVFSKQLGNGFTMQPSFSIPLQQLPAGTYNISVITKDRQQVERIIIF